MFERPLYVHEKSNDDYSPYHLWMVRGIEESVGISPDDIKKLLESPPLVPIHKVFLPEPLKCLVFAEASSHLYFTTPDLPNVIKAQFFPYPKKKPKAAYKMFMSTSKKYYKENSYPSIKIECDDIITLSAAGSEIFALTVKRGRTKQNNLWKIYRYDINEDKGFVKTDTDQVTVLDFSTNPPDIDDIISFVVTKRYKYDANFYLSGIKGSHVYWGIIKADQKISPKVLLPELSMPNFDTTSSLVLAKSHQVGYSDLTGELLAIDRANGKIYRIVHEKKQPRVICLTPDLKNSPISRPSAISHISMNTSDFTINIHPSKQTLFFYLIVSPSQKKVWTLRETGDFLPLVGGGNKKELTFNAGSNPLKVNKDDDSNLLNFDIGDVDSICVVNNNCIVIGAKNKTGWKALLLPQMMKFLSNRLINRSSKSVSNKSSSKESVRDSYLS